jgi:hypothetical protein
METYLNDSELRARHGAAGEATVAKYTWDNVMKTFVRRLKQQYDELIETS